MYFLKKIPKFIIFPKYYYCTKVNLDEACIKDYNIKTIRLLYKHILILRFFLYFITKSLLFNFIYQLLVFKDSIFFIKISLSYN